jgi:hypothetical protein
MKIPVGRKKKTYTYGLGGETFDSLEEAKGYFVDIIDFIEEELPEGAVPCGIELTMGDQWDSACFEVHYHIPMTPKELERTKKARQHAKDKKIEDKKRKEERDRKELARLLKKYPDA